MEAANCKLHTRLWQARKRSGLEQKQVARLLNHKTCDQISRYERGTRTPSLKTALKLEFIYRTPLRQLFPNHYERYQKEIAVIAEKLAQLSMLLPLEAEQPKPDGSDAQVCPFENPLDQPKPSESEIDAARTHSIRLVRKIGDAISGRNQI